MPATSFYKYLNVQGAKLTLGNQTFKHAKPSDFNDAEDLTVAGVFPMPIEEALKNMHEAFLAVFESNLHTPITTDHPQRDELAQLQHFLLIKPELAGMLRRDIPNIPGGFDTPYFRALSEKTVQDVNAFLQDYRVLCVTVDPYSDAMWSRYADNHQGIVLRICPNLEKDSKFQRFKPVTYRDHRPSLYESLEEFFYSSLFVNAEVRSRAMSEKIIYAKTREWEYENEFRLAVPILNEEPWDVMPYHSEEIPELYLGACMERSILTEIVDLARKTNPHITIYQLHRDANSGLVRTPLPE